nr:MAG TPA: hypothetical protein [Crassvirales sp.]
MNYVYSLIVLLNKNHFSFSKILKILPTYPLSSTFQNLLFYIV